VLFEVRELTLTFSRPSPQDDEARLLWQEKDEGEGTMEKSGTLPFAFRPYPLQNRHPNEYVPQRTKEPLCALLSFRVV
jgi:hypothetical protein